MKPKILLRPIVATDSDILFKWINDRDLVKFNAAFRHISKNEHESWFKAIGQKSNLVFFMIEDIDTQLTIGSCQLLNINLIHRSADLQIRIGHIELQNQGVGTEAVRQLVDFGFSELNLHRISLQVFATNKRAIRVYEKNGFIGEGLLRQAAWIDGNWLDVICMAKIRSIDV